MITEEVSMQSSKERCLNLGTKGSSFDDKDYFVFNLDYNGAICAAEKERRSLAGLSDIKNEEKRKLSSSKNMETSENWIEEFEMALIQSNDDDSISINGSSSSQSSFSFPILSWRGVESPTRMPKPNKPVTLRRQKPPSFPILSCCRF